MTLNYTTTGKVKISMRKYIGKVIRELTIDMNRTARNDAMAQVLWTMKFPNSTRHVCTDHNNLPG